MSSSKVIVARYTFREVFRVPKDVDLSDEKDVWYSVKWGRLYIHRESDKKDWVVEPEWSAQEDTDGWKYPDATEIDEAREWIDEDEEEEICPKFRERYLASDDWKENGDEYTTEEAKEGRIARVWKFYFGTGLPELDAIRLTEAIAKADKEEAEASS